MLESCHCSLDLRLFISFLVSTAKSVRSACWVSLAYFLSRFLIFVSRYTFSASSIRITCFCCSSTMMGFLPVGNLCLELHTICNNGIHQQYRQHPSQTSCLLYEALSKHGQYRIVCIVYVCISIHILMHLPCCLTFGLGLCSFLL